MATPQQTGTVDDQMNSIQNPDMVVTGETEQAPTMPTEEPPVPASIDASGALPQDISVEPPAQPERVAESAAKRQAQDVAGIQPMDYGKSMPEQIQMAQPQPIYETSPEKQKEYYDRFVKFQDAETEEYNRADLEAASVYYVPNDEKAAAEKGFNLELNSQNYTAYVFPEGMTPEAKAAVMVTSGAHSFGYKLPESQVDDPYNADSYISIQPRYMYDLAQQRTAPEGLIPGVTPALLAKREMGRGKLEQSQILTQMGVTNPADQAAVLAADDAGVFTSERLLSGGTMTFDFLSKALKWTGKKATQGLTYEESLYLPSGAVVSMEESGGIIVSTADLAGRRASVENNPENTGMFTIDGEGNRVLRPEFTMDYVGALAAEGYDAGAAEQFVTYMPDAAGTGIRLLGEEAIFGTASAGIRYGIALGQTRGFTRWVDRTYGSADEAFKKGKDGARLAQEYFEEYGSGMMNDWARNMAANSMRIRLDVHGNLPGFSAIDNVKAAGRRLDELATEQEQLLNARHTQLYAGADTANVDKKLAEVADKIKKAEQFREASLEEVYNGSWISDTLKTTGYGVGGAAIAGELVTTHFGGAEYAPLAEILGFVSGHTMFSIAGRGAKGSLKWAARKTDDLVNIPASMLGVLDARFFEKMGAYDELDKLTKEQRQVIRSLQTLSGPQKQAAIANARFVTNLQNSLRGIKDQAGNQIFTDDFLEQTLGIVTGLNLLQIADRQLVKGISLGDIKNLGPGFYAKQELLDKKTELVSRLNYAVNQLLPATAGTETNAQLRGFVEGLDKYRQQLVRDLETESGAVLKNLEEREQLILGVIGQDPKALRKMGLKPGEELDATELHKYLQADDDLFLRAQAALGVPATEAIDKLNARINGRLENITKAAKSYMQAVNGSAYAGGPETLATQVHYATRAGNYGKATAQYKILQQEYGDSALMSVTEVYDELAKDPALVSQFDLGVQSRGALNAGNLNLPTSDQRNFRLLFNDAAGRTMADVEGRLRAAAEAAGESGDDYLETMYGYLGISPNATAIDRWEALRAGLRGDTTRVTKEAADNVQALLGGPENAKAYSARMPLLININEFQQITSGLNTKIRNVYQKQATGKEAVAPKYLYEIMHDAAVNPATGFQFNYLDKANRAPATEVYEALQLANKTYREQYAERYLRGGPAQQVGKGVPPQAMPDLDKARSTGVVEKDEVFDVFIGELKGGLKSTDRVNRVTNNLAQSYGTRVPEGGVQVRMLGGETRTLPEGSFVFLEGDPTTEALRSAMTLHAIDEMRRSPGGAVIRKWLGDRTGAATDAEQVKLMMEGLKTSDFDLSYMENLARMPMLRQNADGSFSEVPLIDMDRAYQEIDLTTAVNADPQLASYVDDAQGEFKTFVARMRSEHMQNVAESREELRSLEIAVRDLGANPADFFVKQFESGDVGFEQTRRVRAAIVDQAKRDAAGQGYNADETAQYVKNTTDKFDELRKQHFSSWIRSKVEGTSERIKVEMDPETKVPLPTKVKGFKAGELSRILGTDGGPAAGLRRDLALEMLGGDIEHYNALSAVADWGLVSQAQLPSNVKIDDIPTGLSIESWISRIYSINRGVVSPRYVGAEALIQSFRMNGLSIVEAMVNDKKLAGAVQKILTSNKPLPTEQENFELMQALMTAAGMSMARWDQLNEIEDITGGEPIEIIMPERPVDVQMQEMQTQIGGA